MRVLVTGSTGLVGNNVTRRLLERDHEVRVLVRATSNQRPLHGLDVEIVEGDVRDVDAVRRACRDVDTVIHSAALIHIGWTRMEESRAVNVEGTRNVARAARDAGARMIHVSTTDTLGTGTRDLPADEETSHGDKLPCTYVVTKREAEAVVRQMVAEEDLNAVIVHPSFMLGPWDWKPSSGRMLLAVAERFTPLAPHGGINMCDVRDVAEGILAAWRNGRPGRGYILGGRNLRYVEAWRLFAEVTKSAKPWFCAGPLMRVIGAGAGDLWTQLSGHEPDVNSASVAMSGEYHYYKSDRAITELGYHCRPLRESVEDAWHWFCDHGYTQRTPKSIGTEFRQHASQFEYISDTEHSTLSR